VEGVVAAFRSLGPGRILALFLGLAAVAAITTYMVGQVNQPGMALLYGGLNAQEASRIQEYLSTQNIPHEVRGEGAVYVAANQVGQARLSVAGEGLVGSGTGYELFDNQSSFGTSNFVSNLNAKRALEGELARTIGTLPAVLGARVHLVLPKQNLFSRETIDPSAAVALNLGARSLEQDQVRAIAQLVASSVPNLKTGAITIIDQRGSLLFDGSTEQGGSAQATKVQRDIEQTYVANLTSMLERVVGPGKVAVRVTAEVNAETVSEQSEIFDPSQQVVRSEQVVESTAASTNGAGNGGLTGVQGNTPGGDVASGGNGGGGSNESRTETTTNYEIGRTTRSLERMGGEVKKLSVAVLVEGKTTPAATEGGEATYTPLSESEKNNLRTLVQGAIGFDPARGDRVEVVEMQFSPAPTAEEIPEPFLTKAQMIMLAQYLLIVVALAIIGLMVVKPALSTLNAAMLAAAPVVIQQGSNNVGNGGLPLTELPGGDNLINVGNVQGRVRESAVKKVGEIVDQYPEESLGVLRGWMAGNNGAGANGGEG
jgi:flagellar M-ring protein FliF